MSIGIFGGAFDPPHNGHVYLAEAALRQLPLRRLLLLPTGNSPHKRNRSSLKERTELVRRAFCDERMEICELEGKRNGKSYTFLTVSELKKRFPEEELILILGGDSLRDFHKWVKPDEILRSCTLAAMERAGADSEEIFSAQEKRFGISILRLQGNAPKISSTEIRVRIAFGRDVSEEVPEKVLCYIREYGMYREYNAMTEKLRSYLTETRYLHTMRVALKALELNRQLDLEENKVMTAAVLHDCAKYLTRADQSRYGFVNAENYPESVVHAFLGAAVAKKDFRVRDAEILDAIRYHTTDVAVGTADLYGGQH